MESNDRVLFLSGSVPLLLCKSFLSPVDTVRPREVDVEVEFRVVFVTVLVHSDPHGTSYRHLVSRWYSLLCRPYCLARHPLGSVSLGTIRSLVCYSVPGYNRPCDLHFFYDLLTPSVPFPDLSSSVYPRLRVCGRKFLVYLCLVHFIEGVRPYPVVPFVPFSRLMNDDLLLCDS